MKDYKCAHCAHCNEIKYGGFFCDMTGYLENKRIEDDCSDFSADAEIVRRGRWREISAHRDYDGDILRDYECTECLAIIRDIPDVWQSENYSLYRYCPNCGARMEGGEHDAGSD